MTYSRGVDRESCQPDLTLSNCETCGNLSLWIFDAVSGQGEVRCIYYDPDAFHRSISIPDRDLDFERRTYHRTHVPMYFRWLSPNMPFRGDTNSAFYVPLFLDAADLLNEHSRSSWENHLLSVTWWRKAVTLLRDEAPISRQQLIANLEPVMHHVSGVQNLIREMRQHNLNQSLSFRDAVTPLIQHDGYIHRNIQEILLQAYGDAGFSARVNVLTNAFRQNPHPISTHGIVTKSQRSSGDHRGTNRGSFLGCSTIRCLLQGTRTPHQEEPIRCRQCARPFDFECTVRPNMQVCDHTYDHDIPTRVSENTTRAHNTRIDRANNTASEQDSGEQHQKALV